jgi:hypothetical protein
VNIATFLEKGPAMIKWIAPENKKDIVVTERAI